MIALIDGLFTTRFGVACLFVGGIFFFFIVAVVSERMGKKRYFDHEDPATSTDSDEGDTE